MSLQRRSKEASCYPIHVLSGATKFGIPLTDTRLTQIYPVPPTSNGHHHHLEIPPPNICGWVNRHEVRYDPHLAGIPVCIDPACAREIFRPIGEQPCLILFKNAIPDPALFLALHLEEQHHIIIPYTEPPYCNMEINDVFAPYGLIYYDNRTRR